MNTLIPLPIIIFILLVLAGLSFFISASETAIIGLSKIRLRHLLAKAVKRSQSLHNLITKSDSFIAAILITNNFANIAMSAVITAICVYGLGYRWGVLIATFISGVLILILCEITPKMLAIKHSEKISLAVAPFWEMFIKMFHPGIKLFTNISNYILKILRMQPTKRSPLITEEELRLMIEVGKEEGVLSDEERKMLHRIFEFGDTRVKEVMMPKEKMAAVDINTTSDQLLNIFVEEGHARLPVFQGTIDNIVGIVYAHDLLYILRDKGLFMLPDLLRPPYFVKANAQVNEVLRIFQADKIQIAIVQDEQKKTLGLVTLEDLLEEIVGEIEEEHKYSRKKH